jgi:hypothetical protein
MEIPAILCLQGRAQVITMVSYSSSITNVISPFSDPTFGL